MLRQQFCRILSCAVFVAMAAKLGAAEPAPVDYSREVRPILSDTCYQCHGPDEATREAGLRLDVKDAALAEQFSGAVPIVPGDVGASEIYRRITAEDPAVRMPPSDSGKQLSDEQISTLKRWIEQGAPWREHWSFITPERPPVPEVARDDWARNPIDNFIQKRLEEEGLQPSDAADKVTLIRRVTLDLTGLPPTLDEIDRFLLDEEPGAYERLVDRLLKSPRYGEHMARYWLDGARYGDTHGLHLDNERSMWPYREWVIEAFNQNMPFDRFTVEQIAGDLLPNPTRDQLIATGFNRCNVTTSEGGSIAEEYLVRYAVDRVETTSTVWMGLTTGCAACHDHKFDPISQKEFYELFAFFNSLTEKAMDGNALAPPPIVQVPSDEQAEKREQLGDEVSALEQEIREAVANFEYQEPADPQLAVAAERQDYVWLDDELPTAAKPAGDGGGEAWKFVGAPEHPVHSGQKSALRESEGRSQHLFTEANPALRIGEGDTFFAHVYLDPQNPPQQIMLQFNDGNWEHRAYWGENLIDWGQENSASRRHMGPLPELGEWVRLEVPAEQVGFKPASTINGWAFTQYGGRVYWDTAGLHTSTPQGGMSFDSLAAWERLQKTSPDDLPEPVQTVLKLDAKQRTEEQQRRLRDYFVEHVYSGSRETFEPLHAKLATVKKALADLEKAIPVSLIMEEMAEPREAFVLHRGEYDKPGEKVERDVPAALPPLPDGAPRNRLGLARWLVDRRHPLTARVTVNRFWQQYFGTGIVKTTEDFGSQGEWPSHPELLDWLAVEFIESGWDVKELQKLIVMSATYRQSSKVDPELLARDPQNRLLARGPRFRMDAEMIRDNALALSGLLVEQIGGKSVKPYQPEGLWEAVGYTNSNTARFSRDDGAALYRRSVYTFWKRTSPPPSMLTFDAPSRESCTVRRARTNTPLQALVLMNDEQYVEASRKFARRIVHEGGETAAARAAWAFRLATSRQADEDELAVLMDVYQTHLESYRQDAEAARQLLAVGEAPRDSELDDAELAAWTMVANLLLNLDETITKG